MTLAPELCRGAILCGPKPCAERLDEALVRFEAGRRMELESCGGGQRPFGAEEVLRALGLDRSAANPARVGPEPRPVAPAPNEAGRDGVREDVDHLVEDVVGGLEAHGAVAVGVPEGLPAPERAVHGARDEPVEVAVEVGEPGLRVAHDQVEVVREHAERVDQDAVSLGGDREDVTEDVVRRLRGTEEEAALRATARHEVDRAWEDLSRCRHEPENGNPRAGSRVRNPAGLPNRGRPRGGRDVRSTETSLGRVNAADGVAVNDASLNFSRSGLAGGSSTVGASRPTRRDVGGWPLPAAPRTRR